tara:strand:- start:280836 stop:281258 length:423 start_codon:yes stop_codon:yes gene_type:complete
MVNSNEFSKRLQIILDYYDISAATFADKIQVGRSSISHILSGRNKPSLDFVLKIVENYREVELYWLLNGKGSFPKSEQTSTLLPAKDVEKSEKKLDLFSEKEISKLNQPEKEAKFSSSSAKIIKRVVLFYEDGTFEAFEN